MSYVIVIIYVISRLLVCCVCVFVFVCVHVCTCMHVYVCADVCVHACCMCIVKSHHCVLLVTDTVGVLTTLECWYK